jgi:hypothetical protein
MPAGVVTGIPTAGAAAADPDAAVSGRGGSRQRAQRGEDGDRGEKSAQQERRQYSET